ncbi:MAG: hypothetical protein ACFE8M_07055 [Candidatus Hermodarchaeota archaeon]
MTKDLLNNLFQIVKKKGAIDDELINYIEDIFPNKSQKVLEVINKGVSKYIYKPSNRTVWITLGENCEHLIYPAFFCSCQDFYKNVVVKRKRLFCKHILAQIICNALNLHKEVELKDEDFKNLLNDLDMKFQ